MKNSRLTLPLLACAAVPMSSCVEQAPQKPNVIIIYADDIGFGDLSCNGATTISTPNVERLAAQGVRFTNAHTTSSTSTPARFGLLTGQYPWRVEGTGIAAGDAGMIIAPNTFTLATMMQHAGYKTGAVGKWHLGLGESQKQDWNGLITPGLTDIGFDYSFIMAATGDRVPCVYIENQRVYNYDEKSPIEVSYVENFEGEPTGKENPEMLRLHPSHGHDMSIVNGISRIGFMRGGGKALWVDEDIADVITAKAVDFIESNKKEPFFLYFGTNDIHVPRAPHSRFAGKSGMGARGDAILSFDWSVGQVMAALQKAGIADNTIVILSSDNGPVVDDGYKDMAVELLGQHKPWGNMRGGKYSAFEAATRVPMIIKWDKQRKTQGGTNDALVSHIDLFRSLSTVCSAPVAADAAPDSKDMANAFMGIDTKGRNWVVEQNLHGTLSLLSADGMKYIEPSDAPAMNEVTNTELGNLPSPQLYDTKADIGERNNLAASNATKVKELSTVLQNIKNTKGY